MMAPIGFFRGSKKNKNEARRQGVLQKGTGYIELVSGQQFEQALQGLNEFSHLWLIYQFHQNSHWKPMVAPPRLQRQKKGVFATRSPYRPNFLGLSVVQLVCIQGLKIWIEGSDLLDQTPIFDLKPYLKYCDAVPDATEGWLKDLPPPIPIEFSNEATQALQWLENHGVDSLFDFIHEQLEYHPLDEQKKRIKRISTNEFCLSYRTWRVYFQLPLAGEATPLLVLRIESGYSYEELAAFALLPPSISTSTSPPTSVSSSTSISDPYHDLAIHHCFSSTFRKPSFLAE